LAFNISCPKCKGINRLYIRDIKWIDSGKPDKSFTFGCHRCWKPIRVNIGKVEALESPSEKLKRLALGEVGKPYRFGAQHKLGTPFKDIPEWDCSEIVRHLMYQTYNKIVPDGSYNQFSVTYPIRKVELSPSDVGFLKNKKGKVYHVAIAIDEDFLVEARGKRYGVVKTPIEAFMKRGGLLRRWKWKIFGFFGGE